MSPAGLLMVLLGVHLPAQAQSGETPPAQQEAASAEPAASEPSVSVAPPAQQAPSTQAPSTQAPPPQPSPPPPPSPPPRAATCVSRLGSDTPAGDLLRDGRSFWTVRTEVALLSDLQRFSAVWTGSLGYRRTVIGYQRVRPFSDRAGNGCPWSRRATDDAPRDLSPEERELWAQRRAGSDVQYPPGSQLSEIREHGPIPTGVDIGLDLGLGVWAGPTSRPVATVVAVVEVPLYFHAIGVEVGVGVGLGALFGTLAQEAVPAQSPAYFLARATAFVSVFEMLRLDVGLPLLTDGNASHTGLTLTLGISFGRSAYPRLVDDPSWP